MQHTTSVSSIRSDCDGGVMLAIRPRTSPSIAYVQKEDATWDCLQTARTSTQPMALLVNIRVEAKHGCHGVARD